MLPALAASLAVALGATAARADAGDCDSIADLKDHPILSLAHITGSARTPFVRNASDRRGCPAMTDACRAKAYLVRGDRVVAGLPGNGFACAVYLSPKGVQRTGWLPEASLKRDAPEPVAPNGWLGTWVQDEGQIKVAPNGAGVMIHGYATYGAKDPERAKRGAVNVGAFDATAAPSGPDLAFTIGTDTTLPIDKGEEGSCKVWLRRLGPYLLADDSNSCGGLNVTFRGVYTRKP